MNAKAPRCESPPDAPLAADGSYDPDPVTRGRVRASRMGRRRALVLVAIHVVVFARILHWKLTGSPRVVAPVEPSEAMYALADGVLNAGALMLIISMLSVLVLGRFFCGWACHLVALQDASAWLLKKVGIRPRPLRSRWLVLIPLGAGLFMFGMPLLNRLVAGVSSGRERGFFTDDLWQTFPGFWVGLATFLFCGFGMVYLLGAKGFCTYACPYGGLFGVADRLSPLRIRVDDSCRACGHCTAVCTSNVEVAFEVHRYGAVVDPGCMKCLDCVSVCPENALSLGFGRPALFTPPRREGGRDRRRFPGFAAELIGLAVFAVSLAIFVGLPNSFLGRRLDWASSLAGRTPLLFGLGLAATTGILALALTRTFRGEEFRLQRWVLRRDGKATRGGRSFAFVAGLILLLVGWLGLGQWFMWKGDRLTADLRPRLYELASRPETESLPEADRAVLDAADRAYARAESLRVFPDLRPLARRSGLAAARRDYDAAERHALAALEVEDDFAPAWEDLATVRRLKGDAPGEEAALLRALELDPEGESHLVRLVALRMGRNDLDGALAMEIRLLDALPPEEREKRAIVLAQIATIELRRGRVEEGRKRLDEALRVDAGCLPAHATLAALLEGGDPAAAIPHFEAVLARHPFDFGLRYRYRAALEAAGRGEEARADFEAGLNELQMAIPKAPNRDELLFYLAAELFSASRFEDAESILVPLAERHPEDATIRDLLARTRAAR
ncbi:MAG: tetratricopeptide repeat protein [Planctomycetota bacterium]